MRLGQMIMRRWKLSGGNALVAAGLSARGCGFERPRGSWFERPRRLDYAPDHVSVVNERCDNALVAADLSARDCGLERPRGSRLERSRQLDYVPDHVSVVTVRYAKKAPVAAYYVPLEGGGVGRVYSCGVGVWFVWCRVSVL